MNLLKDPVSQLLKKLAFPVSVGFFFNTMSNIVDSLYVGSINVEALAALGISFPVFFIVIAIGSGFGQGVTVLIGSALGAKNTNLARTYILNSFTFIIFISLVLSCLVFIYAESIFIYLGANGSYLNYTLSYVYMLAGGIIFFLLNHLFNAFLQVQGDTKSFRNALIIGFILNIILNPILMYGWFGLPPLDIKGISLSTVIVQMLSCCYLGFKVWKSKLMNECLNCCQWSILIPSLHSYNQIAKQGFIISFSMLMIAASMFIYNYFLSKYGSNAIASYSIGMRIEQIFLLPSVGLNVASLNLITQNAGAKEYVRVKEIYYTSLKYGFYIALFCFVSLQIFRFELMGLFTNDLEVINLGAAYLVFASYLSYFYMVIFQTISLYQGFKRPLFGLIFRLIRQCLLPLLIIPIMASFYGVMGVWIGISLIVVFGAIIALWLGLRKVKAIQSL